MNPVSEPDMQPVEILPEPEAKSFLRSHGCSVPRGNVVTSGEEGAEVFRSLPGDRAILKVVHSDIPGASTWRGGAGIKMNCTSTDDIRSGVERIMESGEEEGRSVRVLVEEQIDTESGGEIIVGLYRDPSLGPAIYTGSGGEYAERIHDPVHRLVPVSRESVQNMLEGLKINPLLEEAYEKSRKKDDELIRTLVSLGEIFLDEEHIQQIEMNPILASPGRTIILDALIWKQLDT